MNDTALAVARPLLDPSHVDPRAARAIAEFHAETLSEVARRVRDADVVVIGMAQNPHVKRARRVLEAAKIPFAYHEYGSYFSAWRQRLAIKMWSGWSTFPQVFVRGVLFGGANEVTRAIEDGSLRERLGS